MRVRTKTKAVGERTKRHNWLDRNGANELSAIIRKYWADRGKTVMTWLEPVYGYEEGTLFAVRSNMIGGLPQ